MDGNVLPSKLLSRLSNAAGLIRSHNFIQVYSHYDADGLSAAGIIANVLLRENKQFRIRTFTSLEEEAMQEVRECKYDCILMTDLGASYISELEALGKDVIVLDHHTVQKDSDKICYANPHLVDIDGSFGACAATMAFLFGITVNENNWDLVQLAFAGITGDKQHIKGITGLNEYLLNEGTKRGFITTSEGSLIPAGPVSRSLYYTTDPYIRGITGNQAAVDNFLKDARIPADRNSANLTDDEKRRLSSMIAVRLTEQGVSTDSMTELARTRYYLRDWKMDAESLAELLDACGRTMTQGIGIAMCIGSKDDLLRAMELRDQYNNSIMEATVRIDRDGLKQMENFQYFDSTETGFTGVLCGIMMHYVSDPSKPTIGMNTADDKIKLSGRATYKQLDRGVDLAVALRESTKTVGGEGGGHSIASGGSIPLGTSEEFLKNMDAIIGGQISSAR